MADLESLLVEARNAATTWSLRRMSRLPARMEGSSPLETTFTSGAGGEILARDGKGGEGGQHRWCERRGGEGSSWPFYRGGRSGAHHLAGPQDFRL